MIKLLTQEKDSNDEIHKQLNLQYAHIFKLMEDVRELNQKIDRISLQLEEIKQLLEKTPLDSETTTITKKDKIKEAIKMILRKKGKMTSEELAEIVGLSRTRCNEYLKEMERNKEARAEVINRKKYYKLA
ncbi:MAG: winged helix-turn-helix transcriptional regulator [Candidatus Aenigmarchaeota archaeon]|nr:winged helix-turn-helix transcriptional regulator [Candidatus Aenigmarchaeota archaeon]MBU5688717.1 winged helix-turn-helix transcriptional regulator [Candidatus Aenigmarchaeota archaeon]